MKRARLKAVWFIALLLVLLSALPALAAPQPSRELYVYDEANIFSSEVKESIVASSNALAEKTGAQIAVATVNSLDGQPIRDVSLDMLRSWGLGDKDKDNGVLILLAVEDRQSAIEVGYGLEGALPDGKTGRIQDERMLPHFREGEYETGLAYGYQEIYNIVCEEYGIDPSEISYFQSPLPTPATPQEHGDEEGMPRWLQIAMMIGAIALLAIDWLFLGGTITRHLLTFFILFGRGGRGGGGGGFGGGGFSGGGGSGGGGGSSRSW